MKLHELNIFNFKFHHELQIKFNGKSTLIYGENGTGKSSIYEALKINLNSTSISREVDINDLYKHRDYLEAMQVNLSFNENLQTNIYREQNSLTNELEYFSVLANEKKFHLLLDTNFFNYINETLQIDFKYLTPLIDIYRALDIDINRNLTNENRGTYIDKRIDADNTFLTLFHEKVNEDVINNIIQNDFNENLNIKFNIKPSQIIDSKLINPTISISVVNIDDRGNFKEHFNEAKLKLISMAIYFSLAKKQEEYLSDTEQETKLLILDDFLTSLDMSNRKLIIQYILNSFNEYQIIILTHNIQFSNLIIKLIKSRNESVNWEFKNLFSRYINGIQESIIYTKQTDYLQIAENYLSKNRLSESGNFLRKEFERILEELRQIHEIGSKEKLNHIVNGLLTQDVDSQYRFTATLKNNINDMQLILQKTKFYQDTIFHSASHDDITNEIYEKDCRGAITTLKELKKYIKNIKDN